MEQSVFRKIFGADPSLVKKNCIIIPHGEKELFNQFSFKSVHKGFFYDLIDTDSATLLLLKRGLLAGDCVLSLKETACGKIFLFGSCGGIDQKQIGEAVIAEESVDMENFAKMLDQRCVFESHQASPELLETFLKRDASGNIKRVKAASLGSLLMEKDYLPFFEKNNIGCVDMQSSSVLAASRFIKRPAIALFYVSDIIGRIPFYAALKREDRQRIHDNKKKIINPLIQFIQNDH